jgi:hypothetical protein
MWPTGRGPASPTRTSSSTAPAAPQTRSPKPFDPVLSAVGRYLSFADLADGHSPFPGEPYTNQGVYVLDRVTRSLQRASVNNAGEPANNGAFFGDALGIETLLRLLRRAPGPPRYRCPW